MRKGKRIRNARTCSHCRSPIIPRSTKQDDLIFDSPREQFPPYRYVPQPYCLVTGKVAPRVAPPSAKQCESQTTLSAPQRSRRGPPNNSRGGGHTRGREAAPQDGGGSRLSSCLGDATDAFLHASGTHLFRHRRVGSSWSSTVSVCGMQRNKTIANRGGACSGAPGAQ